MIKIAKINVCCGYHFLVRFGRLSFFALCFTGLLNLSALPADALELVQVFAEIEATSWDLYNVYLTKDPQDSDPILLEGIDSPWEFGFNLDKPDDHGIYLYADTSGRVRTFVTTGVHRAIGSQFGYAYLDWSREFTRDNSDNPTFTLNPSWIEVFAQLPGSSSLIDARGQVSVPYAGMGFEIFLCADFYGLGGDINQTGAAEFECTSIFAHYSGMSGIVNDKANPLQMEFIYTYDAFIGKDPFAGVKPEKTYFSDCIALPQHPTCFSAETGLRYEVPSYTQEIDLTYYGIPLGGDYVIIYELQVEAGENGAESFAEARLGDPLDAGVGGLTLSTSHTTPENEVRICSQTPDPARFIDNGDATVTDSYFGLMWQRCPLGYTLDDSGTAADPGDDRCEAGTAMVYDWQAALQAASGDTLADYNDWQLPNVKQLESLVELSCVLPAIDASKFPDTPSLPFWSSTPAAGDKAWSVSFGTGGVNAIAKTGAHRARLVRPSGSVSAPPKPALVAGNARVSEGDSGATQLVFPVVLTRPASADVSVDYQTQAVSASAGIDYVAASGTLTIPAGQLGGEVVVVVNPDTEAENDELLRLLLSNSSANAFIADALSEGTILDDEPIVSVSANPVGQLEGDTGSRGREFVIQLDKPAVSDVSVDFTTVDGSAAAGTDYSAAAGTLTINTNETSAALPVAILGDDLHENDETFEVVISNVTGGAKLGAAAATATIVDDDVPGTYRALNDTGVTYCANATSTLLSCPQAGFPQQDGEVGRDVTANDPADGIDGFSFTKLDGSGLPLANQTAIFSQEPWDCVRDEVTGLTWEVKSDVPTDLRFYDWTYSWFISSGVNDGGDAGVANGGSCADGTNCDTEKYVAAVNVLNLCGYNDWRVPSIGELYTLARTASPSASALRGLDKNFFPHNYSTDITGIKGFSYWSATPSASVPEWAWVIRFRAPDPTLRRGDKGEPVRIRLVRSGF